MIKAGGFAMKKFLKIISIIFISFLIICLVFTFADRWWFYHLWYFSDRITIHITMDIEGENVIIDKKDIQCSEYADIKDCEDKIQISIPAHSYGDYEISFSMNSIPITLQLYQFNWWDVQEINLDMKVNLSDKKLYYSVKHTSLTEKAYKTTCYYSNEIMLDDECNYIGLERQKEYR